MAQDITEQASQEEIADSLISDPEPPPQEQTDTEEAQPEPVPEQEGEEQTEEAADDWLPTEQEKVFPDEVLAKYATRYNVDLAKADPQVRQLIIDKINSDIYLKSLQTQQQEEPEEEEFEPEPDPVPEPTQPQPQVTFEQHVKNIQSIVKQRTSPEMAQWMYKGFMTAFGVPEAEVNSLAPTQAQAFTEVLSVGALNLIQTFAPELFSTFVPQVMEQQFAGFGTMYERAQTASQWDAVRNQSELDLPAYGTKEFKSAVKQAAIELAGSLERFDAMILPGANGQPLNKFDNVRAKYEWIAEHISQGTQSPQIPPPAVMAQAVKTGEKIAQRRAAQQSAGNLGAGKSRAQIAPSNDDPFAEGVEIYNQQHGRL